MTKEPSTMWNRYYYPYRRGIRFFPHIVPIAFPLIFPFGIGLLFAISHFLLSVLGILLLGALALFVIRAVTMKSPEAAWNSMKATGSQWQQRFTSQYRQPSYTQPEQPYYQPSQQQPEQKQAAEQPYYQPSQPTAQYGQGYQSEQVYYRPTTVPNDFEQPRTQYPEQMPPMQH